MEPIDLTMTTALRPDVLDKTLRSIRKNLILDRELRLIINIALVGGLGKYTELDVHVVIQKYFTEYLTRSKKVSSSTDGLKWTWGKVQSDYILQWEDDWELLEKVDLSVLIKWMNQNSWTDMISLDRCGKSVLDYPESMKLFKHTHSNFWAKIDGTTTLVGFPTLYRRERIKEVVNLIDPQFQLGVNSAKDTIQSVIHDWNIYTYTGIFGSLVQDIGRAWMEKNNLVRSINSGGRTWVKGK